MAPSPGAALHRPTTSGQHESQSCITLGEGALIRRWVPVIAAFLAAGPSHSIQAQDVELTVSAASSLTDAFETLADRFTEAHPSVHVRLNFGGSNHLQRQIEGTGGRGVDVFAAAGAGPTDALERAGLIVSKTRADFAGNEIVLICPKGNSAGLTSFEDLDTARVRRIAIGTAEVPVGRYARQVLWHLGMAERLSNKFLETIHVRQAADYVVRGEVDAALVYRTDAAELGSRAEVVARARPGWHEPIRYPIAVLTHADHPAEARLFVAFVMSAAGRDVLSQFGFLPPMSGTDAAGRPDGAPPAPGQPDSAPPLEFDPTGPRPTDLDPWTAMKLSLIAATGALLFVFPVGTALGALLAKRRFPGREVLDAVFTLPMVLPPTVVGYYLIIVLGARSPAGRALESWFGVRVALTLLGATLASAVIALPLMIKSARAAFETVDREYELASYTLGKGKIETLFRVTLPLARHGLMAGVILSFARAIGEFGATFMLAGIIPGRTMTMPVAIFHAFTNHDDRTAQILVLILTAFSAVVIYATNRLNARQSARNTS